MVSITSKCCHISYCPGNVCWNPKNCCACECGLRASEKRKDCGIVQEPGGMGMNRDGRLHQNESGKWMCWNIELWLPHHLSPSFKTIKELSPMMLQREIKVRCSRPIKMKTEESFCSALLTRCVEPPLFSGVQGASLPFKHAGIYHNFPACTKKRCILHIQAHVHTCTCTKNQTYTYINIRFKPTNV